MWHLDDSLLYCFADVMDSFGFFEERAPRKIAENTANRGGGEILVVVTTLELYDCMSVTAC